MGDMGMRRKAPELVLDGYRSIEGQSGAGTALSADSPRTNGIKGRLCDDSRIVKRSGLSRLRCTGP